MSEHEREHGGESVPARDSGERIAAVAASAAREERDREDRREERGSRLTRAAMIPVLPLVVGLLGGGGVISVGGFTTASTLSKKIDDNAAITASALQTEQGKLNAKLDAIQSTVQGVESDLKIFKAGDIERRVREADYETRLRALEKTIAEYGVQLRDARRDSRDREK